VSTATHPAAALLPGGHGGLSAGGAGYARASSRSPAAGAAVGKASFAASSATKQQLPSQRHPSPQHHNVSSLGFSPQTASLPPPGRGGGARGGYGYGAGGSVGGGLSPERGAGEYVYA
jgi:hypothetical protein